MGTVIFLCATLCLLLHTNRSRLPEIMSETTDPRSKRKRAASPAGDASTEQVARSDAIWFDDGNIVLQAERMQFRVHCGVLIKYSGVFRDMFDVGHPGSQSEATVDGVPVVHLHDSQMDVEWILRALYGDRR